MASRFWLRLEPYDPDARDGDGDGIVQERTAWERPVGTRIIDDLGQELKGGQVSSRRKESFRIVDRDGKPVDYIPSYAKEAKIPTERPKTSLEKRGVSTIRSRGVRSLDEVVTEAIALSRASAPGSPQPDETRAPQGIPTEKAGPPKELTAGPELVADLLAEIQLIKSVAPANTKGFTAPDTSYKTINADGTTALFGWEETEEGRRALDAIIEAGDRAVQVLLDYLAGEKISDELRKELDDLHESTSGANPNRKRIFEEIEILKATSWRDTLEEFKSLLMPIQPGESEKNVESLVLLDQLVKRVNKRIDNIGVKDEPEIVTKKDIEELDKIFVFERARRFRLLIQEHDASNYYRWFDKDGRRMDAYYYAGQITGEYTGDKFRAAKDEEQKRRDEVLARITPQRFELQERAQQALFPDDEPEEFFIGISRAISLHEFVRPRFGTGKDKRRGLAERLVRAKYGSELSDLYAELEKPDSRSEARKRFISIDPMADEDKNAQALMALLRAVRSDIGTGDFLGYFDPSLIQANGSAGGAKGTTREMLIEAIEDASSKLPGSWLQSFRAKYDKPKRAIKFLNRGHFNNGEIRLSGGGRGWRSTIIHEVTHGFERTVPGLFLAEALFYNRRAKRVGLSGLKRKYYGTRQWYYDLKLDDNYTSVYYDDRLHFELATMSIEAAYQGDFRAMPPEQLRWILGCMLTL